LAAKVDVTVKAYGGVILLAFLQDNTSKAAGLQLYDTSHPTHRCAQA